MISSDDACEDSRLKMSSDDAGEDFWLNFSFLDLVIQ
jgi:hypothetical protein